MSLEADLAFVGAYIKAPTQSLRFTPRLERRFLVERGRKSREAVYLASVFAMIVVNLTGAGMLLFRWVPPQRFLAGFIEFEVVTILPFLAITALVKRFPRYLLYFDAMLAVEVVLGELGLILLNRELVFPTSVYHAFSLYQVPISFYILFGMRFAYAAPTAAYFMTAFLANDALHGDFPFDAQFFLAIAYVMSTGGSLVANFRVERAERLRFLGLWRDNLKHVETARANRKLDGLARTDGLTGLANRREFDARFATEMARARADYEPLTLIILDIDHFKKYNDSLGHPQGDKCIRAVARALAESAGEAPNFVARIGGEEFAAVLPGAAVEAAAATAQRIRSAVEAMQLPQPALGERRVVSVSIGVACLNPARPESPEALMARADAALYRAKKAGRDRAEVDLRVVGA